MSSTPACPICHGTDTRSLATWRLGYTIRECDGCEVLFSDPLPSSDELSRFYQGFLYKKPDPRTLEQAVATRMGFLQNMLGLREGNGLRLLDHGGGTGLTFAAAQRLGFDAYFNDLDQQAIALVSEQHGLDPQHCVPELATTSERFDVIVSDNVIEHVPDPIATLRELVALLRPKGFLELRTPWAKANEQLFYPHTVARYMLATAKTSGVLTAAKMPLAARVWCCDPPRHLYGFTAQSILTAARNAGIPPAWCQTGGYNDPLLSKTLLQAYVKPPDGVLGIAKRALVLPLVGPELAWKTLHLALRKLEVVTPMGLTLRITRPEAA